MRQEADIFLAAEIMWSSRSNRRKLYPVIYAGVSGEGTVRCLFPSLRRWLCYFRQGQESSGENSSPVCRMGDDGVFDVVSVLKALEVLWLDSCFPRRSLL